MVLYIMPYKVVLTLMLLLWPLPWKWCLLFLVLLFGYNFFPNFSLASPMEVVFVDFDVVVRLLFFSKFQSGLSHGSGPCCFSLVLLLLFLLLLCLLLFSFFISLWPAKRLELVSKLNVATLRSEQVICCCICISSVDHAVSYW